MKILTKKIFREVRFNKFRSIVIILTVAVAIMIGIGFMNVKKSFNATIAAHHANLNNADLRMRLNKYITIDEESLLQRSSIKNAGITDIEGRIFQYTSVDFKGENYKGYLIGVNFNKNSINTLEIERGSLPQTQNEALVERHFGAGVSGDDGIALNSVLTIIASNNTSFNVTISGAVIDSDYLYPVDEHTGFGVFDGDFCIVYVPLDQLQTQLGVKGINEVLVKTQDRSHSASQVADDVMSNIIGSGNIRTVIYWDEAPDYVFFDLDNAHDKIGLIFGLLGLIVGGTAIYNSLSKLILAQRTHIGLYGALGAKRRDVISHYLGFGVFLGFCGMVLGWIGAASLSYF
ncbi:MAG: ABC transporter permease, partial [Promethearchaeota archaeon]